MAMTIGEVIQILKQAPPELDVVYSFCGFVPSGVLSWRGIYDEAAIGFRSYDERGAHGKVRLLLENLEAAIHPDARFEGYKGGTYRFRNTTPLHVDNYGQCTNTEIERITIADYQVMIHTRYERD